MKKFSSSVIIAVWAVSVLVVIGQTSVVEAVTCDPTRLSSCAGAIFLNLQPSNACCERVREQQPCFCQYLENPTYGGFINSDGAQHIITRCNVTFPACPPPAG